MKADVLIERMSMSAQNTIRRSVAMTPQMRARLQQLVEKDPRDVTEADLIRQAIRDYLDHQEQDNRRR